MIERKTPNGITLVSGLTAEQEADKALKDAAEANHKALEESEKRVKAQRALFEANQALESQKAATAAIAAKEPPPTYSPYGMPNLICNRIDNKGGNAKDYYIDPYRVAEELYYDALCKKIQKVTTFNASGQKHGAVVTYGTNGRIHSRERYVNDKPHGKQEFFVDKNGDYSPRPQITDFVDGVEQTRWVRFKNGARDLLGRGAHAVVDNPKAKRGTIGALIGGTVGTFLLPGVGTLIGGAVGAGLGVRQGKDIESLKKAQEKAETKAKIREADAKGRVKRRSLGFLKLALGVSAVLAIGNGIKLHKDKPNPDKKFAVTDVVEFKDKIGGKPSYQMTVEKDNEKIIYEVADNNTSFESDQGTAYEPGSAYFAEVDGDELRMEENAHYREHHKNFNSVSKFDNATDRAAQALVNFASNGATGLAAVIDGNWYSETTPVKTYTADGETASEQEQADTKKALKLFRETYGSDGFIMREVSRESKASGSPRFNNSGGNGPGTN